MGKPSSMQKCIDTKDWDEGKVRRLDWRLDLLYRYKIYFEPDANFSREQMDFINGLMRPEKTREIAFRYLLAISEAIEIAEEEKRRVREERLRTLAAKGVARR